VNYETLNYEIGRKEVPMLTELSIEHFGHAVASEEAVPGGGSVCALAGSLAGALVAMVARLTLNKEKFAHIAPQMETLLRNAQQLQSLLLAAVDRDADSYGRVLAAFRLPKATDEEKLTRRRAIQAAFKKAAEVPLEVANLCLRIMELADQAVRQGNPDMITDAGVTLVLARSAALGALMNVNINLTAITDQAVVEEMRTSTQNLKKTVLKKEQETLAELPL
jgi:formiminotetrahydrofolate cyclodeaminase